MKALDQAVDRDPSLGAAANVLRGQASNKASQLTNAREAFRAASRTEAEDPSYQRAKAMVDAAKEVPARLEEAVER